MQSICRRATRCDRDRAVKCKVGVNSVVIPSPFFPSREAEPHISVRERKSERHTHMLNSILLHCRLSVV